MKKSSLLFAVLTLAFASLAKDMTLAIDTKGAARAAFPCGAPCVGYATDPQVGDEEAVLACRRAGAWLFRTSRSDDATLAFCARYGIRLFLVLDGDRASVKAALQRLAKSPDKKAIEALQLGADPSGGADPMMWRQLAPIAAKLFPKMPLALPVRDLSSPAFARMNGNLGPISHLVVDLRDAPAPYERLQRLAERLRKSSDKQVSRLRLWAVGPGRLAGASDADAAAPAAVAWQMHWIMSALAVDRVSGVFVERPYRADDFGRALRHFWAATTANPSLVGHGEGSMSVAVAQPKARPPKASLSADDDEGLGALDLKDSTAAAGPVPVACANVAAGKPGDVEYLVLVAPPVEKEGQRACLVLVNTTGESVKLAVDVNKKGGAVSEGFRRRLVPDGTTGTMRDMTRARGGNPFSETVESGEVTFLDFRF